MEAAVRLTYLCEIIPTLLRKINGHDFSHKPAPEKWSKKEILGHLIDSAANNHHRLVRGQFEDNPSISYNQDLWNRHNFYQQMSGEEVINFWLSYNKYLLTFIKLLPREVLTNTVRTGEGEGKNVMTLQFIIDDYLDHMEYHLHQIVEYKQTLNSTN